MFKVASLTHCRHCGSFIDRSLNKRLRSFCSKSCRDKHFQRKYQASRSQWQRARYDRIHAKHKTGSIQCQICGRWYLKVLVHVWQRHGVNEREYKQEFNIAHHVGLISKKAKLHMREQTQSNGTIKNLKKGIKQRFRKNDPRTKSNSNPWGGRGSPKPEEI